MHANPAAWPAPLCWHLQAGIPRPPTFFFHGKHAWPPRRYLCSLELSVSNFTCSRRKFEALKLYWALEMVQTLCQRKVLKVLADVFNSHIRSNAALSAMLEPHTLWLLYRNRWLALLRCCNPPLRLCVPCKDTTRLRTL